MRAERLLRPAVVFGLAALVGFGAGYKWGARGGAARREAQVRLQHLERILRLEKTSNAVLQACIQSEKLLLSLTH